MGLSGAFEFIGLYIVAEWITVNTGPDTSPVVNRAMQYQHSRNIPRYAEHYAQGLT